MKKKLRETADFNRGGRAYEDFRLMPSDYINDQDLLNSEGLGKYERQVPHQLFSFSSIF